ncbi:MAG: DUF4340 domain-containing protein [Eubacteriales bacterium]|nr:DUF4340 domain-containing protein [Eubacteriales bacterium]
MKKQIIIVGTVLLVALLLVGVYQIFFKTDDENTEEKFDLSDAVKSEIEKVDRDFKIIISGADENAIKSDPANKLMYMLANALSEANDRISVSFDKNESFYGIIIKSGGDQKQISYDELYKKLENGTKYAFDGERLYTNAILSLCGRTEISGIGLRALEGYDTDGDTVVPSTGYPFMYPNISRSDVLSISVKNQHSSYKAYRAKNNKFYFEGAEIVGYDEERFSSLVVNSTYVLTRGKISNPQALSVYGLDSEENCTAVITVVTLDNATHKIIIGNKLPSGDLYYAKYATKDFVYLLPAADLEAAVLGPVEAYFKANLVNGISSETDVTKLRDVTLDFYDDGTTLKADFYARLLTSSNLLAFTNDDIVTLFTNKIGFKGDYSNWQETATLGGFTSTDGKPVHLEIPLAIYGPEGNYTVSFGILRDEDKGAFLPGGVSASYSVDGDTFTEIDLSGLKLSQGNKELKKYSFDFHSDEKVLYVRVYFNTEKGKYTVLDELTVYADSVDAHPSDGIVGVWKLSSPAEYIPEGRNYVYPNYNFASDFVLKIATLVGDRVVEIGLTSDPFNADTINRETLAKYGLDNPEKHFSYVLNDIKTDVYFSHINENGNYYCYSVISGDKINTSSDIIAEVSPATAPWLNWDIVDFQEQSLVSMYINNIDTLTLSFDNKDYIFVLEKDDNGELFRVTCDGKGVDLKNFRYLYISILRIGLKDEYVSTGEKATEIFKVKIESTSKSPEIIFYRVTTSKVYYTIDGVGKNYVLIDSINTIKNNVILLLAGKDVPHN